MVTNQQPWQYFRYIDLPTYVVPIINAYHTTFKCEVAAANNEYTRPFHRRVPLIDGFPSVVLLPTDNVQEHAHQNQPLAAEATSFKTKYTL